MKGEKFVNYELLIEGTGLLTCVYDAIAGVGRTPDERKIFQDLFKSRKTEYYICTKCVYVITTPKYDIMFKDLNLLHGIGKKVFFNTLKGEVIEVTKQNFSIKCYLNKPQCPEAWVQKYFRKPKHLQ